VIDGSIGTPGLWLGFLGLVIAMLAVDPGMFHRQAHAGGFREAPGWSVIWIGMAVLFNLGVWHWFAAQWCGGDGQAPGLAGPRRVRW
jgi:tellurite resistance protein TerC